MAIWFQMCANLFLIITLSTVLAVPLQGVPVMYDRSRRSASYNDGSSAINHQLYFHEVKPATHMEAYAHESVTLTCQAGGSPPPMIHWLKNGLEILQSNYEVDLDVPVQAMDESGDLAGSDGMTVGLSSTRSRLFLDCLSPQDSAVYTCVAETPYSRISTDTKLIVTVTANKIAGNDCIDKRSTASSGYGKLARITMWTDTRVELTGADVKLYCRASGTPTPQVSWERAEDGQPIQNDLKHKILPNGDLIIKKVTWDDDMGRFICVARNNLGIDKVNMFLYPTPGL